MDALPTTAPVLIVGGGPAGLTLSLLLSRHGIASVLVDKRTRPSVLPRARGVHARAMEIARVCGVEDALRAVELPITPGVRWHSTLSAPPTRTERISAAVEDDVSPCEGLAAAQDVFEGQLCAQAADRPAATVRQGVELTGLQVHRDWVVATLRETDGGRQQRVDARYLIAADGVHSAIRGRLGIPMDGEPDLGARTWIAFRADLTGYVGRTPHGLYVLTDSGSVLLWTHPDNRWVLSGPVDPADRDGVHAADTVRAAIGASRLAVEVLGHRVWTAAAQTARRMRSGPVFLIGDAAHRVPPAGATGVSTAMHDAHNLAWKLAAALGGRAGDALLDTYQTERLPVARRTAAEARATWEAFAGRPPTQPQRSMRQIDMGYRYVSAAIVDDDPTAPDPDAPGSDFTPTARPGCRAPHLWLDTGRHRSTLDLFGSDLVLLSDTGAGWAHAARTVGAQLATPLPFHRIDAPGWAARYGVQAGGAVLVRPDGHVAWRRSDRHADEPGAHAAALTTAIHTALCTAPAPSTV
jgi:2-polyprenyl-6-methoxyphenol hydroxylase-like FAD-dependent oxidoreductase